MRTSSQILAVSLLALAACAPAQQIESELPARPTKTVTVKTSETIETLRLPAVIEASEQSILTFQVPGQLTALPVVAGDEVQKGEVLARLDDRDYRNDFASAQAAYDRAEQEYSRAKALIEKNAIAQAMVDQRLADRNIAKASLDIARKRLSDTVLKAPFSGTVAEVSVDPFESISPAAPIVTLQVEQVSQAVIQLPASVVIDAERIEDIRTWLELDAAPGLEIPVTLFETVARADAATQTFELSYSFEVPEGLLVLPGMTGTVTGEFTREGRASEAISLPVSAIMSQAGETYVWLVEDQDMTVTRRDIQVGAAADDKLVVLSGLQNGDQVVSAGGHYLFEGAEIRPFETNGDHS